MTFGIPFQRVHDVKALGFHQLFGLGVPFGIEAGNRWLVVDHLARQLKLPRQGRQFQSRASGLFDFPRTDFFNFFSAANTHRRSTMNSGSVFAAVLIAINVITLLFITPLNSLILAYPYELVCISCLCTIYGGGILVVGFSLFLANWYGR